jgi:hypothetical protein
LSITVAAAALVFYVCVGVMPGFTMQSHRKPQPFSLFVVMALTASKVGIKG